MSISVKSQPKSASVEDIRSRRVVVFDFDGTVADTVPGIVGTARKVLLDWGMTEEEMGDLRRLVGPPFPQAFTMVYGVSEKDAKQLTANYRTIYRTLGPKGWPPITGIPELLDKLHAAGKLTAIASSKRQTLVELASGQTALGGRFDAIEGKLDDMTDTKAMAIGRALAELGASTGESVMVGDRCYDVEAAAEAGVPCVGVRYAKTCDRSELVDAGASAVAETVGELERILLG